MSQGRRTLQRQRSSNSSLGLSPRIRGRVRGRGACFAWVPLSASTFSPALPGCDLRRDGDSTSRHRPHRRLLEAAPPTKPELFIAVGPPARTAAGGRSAASTIIWIAGSTTSKVWATRADRPSMHASWRCTPSARATPHPLPARGPADGRFVARRGRLNRIVVDRKIVEMLPPGFAETSRLVAVVERRSPSSMPTSMPRISDPGADDSEVLQSTPSVSQCRAHADRRPAEPALLWRRQSPRWSDWRRMPGQWSRRHAEDPEAVESGRGTDPLPRP